MPSLSASQAATVDGAPVASGDLVAAGRNVVLTATPASGYVFSGWTVTGGATLTGGDSANPATFVMPASAVTLTAAFSSVLPPPDSYSVYIAASVGGKVTASVAGANLQSVLPGQTVTLTVTPDAGYALTSISVTGRDGMHSVSTTVTGNIHTFTMPAYDVTVQAAFHKTGWDAARELIEAADFTFQQHEANTQSILCFLLADLINELIKNTDFVISPYDIVIFDYNFRPAQAGTPENNSGVNGYFEFRVTPPDTRISAYNEGTIVATAYDAVANEQLTMNNEQLRAWVQNGVLHVSGLTVGKPWYVYNLYGQLIYTGNVETQCLASQIFASPCI